MIAMTRSTSTRVKARRANALGLLATGHLNGGSERGDPTDGKKQVNYVKISFSNSSQKEGYFVSPV
jgi:hypothetical protein